MNSDHINTVDIVFRGMNGECIIGGRCYPVAELIKATNGLKPQLINIDKLTDELQIPLWDDDIKPIDIIRRRDLPEDQMSEHWARIDAADTSFPLIVNFRYNVLDGLHRLCKLYMSGMTHVQVYVLNDATLSKIARSLGEDSTDGY